MVKGQEGIGANEMKNELWIAPWAEVASCNFGKVMSLRPSLLQHWGSFSLMIFPPEDQTFKYKVMQRLLRHMFWKNSLCMLVAKLEVSSEHSAVTVKLSHQCWFYIIANSCMLLWGIHVSISNHFFPSTFIIAISSGN